MHAGRCNDGDSVVANVPLEKKNRFDMVSYFLKKRWLALTKRIFTVGRSSQARKQMCSGLLEAEKSHVGTSV